MPARRDLPLGQIGVHLLARLRGDVDVEHAGALAPGIGVEAFGRQPQFSLAAAMVTHQGRPA